jgi:ribosomal protein S18 acetylase RimI-like enzyme
MLIRPFQIEDEHALIRLWKRAGLTRSWNDPRKDILRKLRVQSQWFLIGLVGDHVIASVMAGYDGHRGWVNYLALDPDHQGNGHGRAIMKHVEELLCDAGCPKINLQIRQDNLDAIAFYQRIGFLEDSVISFGKRLIADE